MLRPVHHTLFMTEVLSWSLTILVLASQQPQQSDMTSSHRFHIWINGSHNAKESRDGTFVSPGFPTTHFSLATTYNFHLTHRSKHGHVKLNFTDFFLMPLDNSAQCGSLLSDYVKIMDGTSVTRHCSHLRPQPYISSSHELTLEYYYTPSTGSFLHHSLLRVGYQFLSRAEAMIEWDNLIRGYYGKSY
ncbi:uncharacterized protein LOC115929842 [Strongylocentrotus purpuratus]|uniref:CUB domain-containing protein n=1 Tax=Strongylocentrotus purpuratus TaxID=7668 RepID=A0A7M7PRH8_STRPU|nr:uncharacterized protein LOC115929842 [Strongylocentrotus purpuratus]